jgi:ribosomal protein L11 methylase PrmA
VRNLNGESTHGDVALRLPPQCIGTRYMPTPQPVVEAMLTLAKVSAEDTVYDVGCGDGRVVITAALTFGARGVGIDIERWCVAESRRNARRAGVESLVRFVHANALDVDLSPATVVTLYMPAAWNRLLLPKLRRELSPAARVVSYMYELGDESPESAMGDGPVRPAVTHLPVAFGSLAAR